MSMRTTGSAPLLRLLVAPLVAVALGAASAGAEMKSRLLGAIELPSPALDVAISPDGQTLAVLTAGSLLIYSPDGTLRGSVPLDAPADSLAVSPRGDAVILGSRESKTVRFIALEQVVQISLEGAPFKGAADSQVVITVFTDFQCPYCAGLVPLLEQVLEKYPTQVRLVYKSFPLGSHPFARKAAIAAMAADRQGLFWPVHDAFFLASSTLNDESIRTIVKEVGADMTQFDADVADPALAARVDEDLKEGQLAGVRGTPTVFVNGRQLANRNMEGFARVIDTLLAAGKQPQK